MQHISQRSHLRSFFRRRALRCVDREACTAESGGLSKCTDALLGQKAATELAGRTPVSLMWLTHSEQMPASKQCAAVAGIIAQYGDWIQAGTDFFDGSHVTCNWTSSA